IINYGDSSLSSNIESIYDTMLSPSTGTDVSLAETSIYPNPCSNSATISIPTSMNSNEPADIQIYDISGRLVKNVKTTSDFTWDLISNNGTVVPDGIYLVRISTSLEDKVLKLLVVH
ncbi:MAG: hypothetical protein DRH49_07945, partial [Candidatus Coatesbacteria bacterium]